MDKSKNFERSIPENYVLVKHVNAKSDKKQMLAYTLLSLVPVAIIAPILLMIAKLNDGYNAFADAGRASAVILVALIADLAYVVLHEITHGITYKCFTGGKLTFGMTLTVAFCGVPDLYVRKKAAVAALIMPFAVFGVIFTALTIGLWFVDPLYGIAAGLLLSIHIGGCVGDLHWTLMYLTKYRRFDTLMRDTGPEQWLYIPRNEAEEYGVPIIEE